MLERTRTRGYWIGLVDCEKKPATATPAIFFSILHILPFNGAHQEVLSQRNAGERSGKENYHFQ